VVILKVLPAKINEGYFTGLRYECHLVTPVVETNSWRATDEGTGNTYGYHAIGQKIGTACRPPNFGTKNDLEENAVKNWPIKIWYSYF